MIHDIRQEYLKRTIKTRWYSRPKNLFELQGMHTWIYKWMKKHLPHANETYHVLLRNWALDQFKRAREEYNQKVNREFFTFIGRKYEPKDYTAPDVVCSEFPEEVKNKLRVLLRDSEEYYQIAYAHHLMLLQSYNRN